MRLSEYGDTNKFQKTVRINHKSTGALFGGFVYWYQKSKGRPSRRKEHLSLDLSLLARDLFGILKTKMEKSNHDSFGKLKSILKVQPIFLVAFTHRYFFGGVVFLSLLLKKLIFQVC